MSRTVPSQELQHLQAETVLGTLDDMPTPRPARNSNRAAVTKAELDALLAACRVLVAVSARSIAAVADVVDVTQFRALVIVASRGSVSLGTLAEAAGLSLSTASRMCDRMVGLGLLHRADDPTNRRQLVLTPTDAGKEIVDEVMQRRRDALAPALGQLTKARRAELVTLLAEFAAAGGEPAESDLWSMGWTS